VRALLLVAIMIVSRTEEGKPFEIGAASLDVLVYWCCNSTVVSPQD
jgi:hypothetical protein